MDFHGKFYGKCMDPPFHKIRLLGPRLYKGNPFKQLHFMELDQLLWKRDFHRKPIKLRGILVKIRLKLSPLIISFDYIWPLTLRSDVGPI
jgi:hypothetical protein